MPSPRIVGFSGNFARPSRTLAFVTHVAHAVAGESGGIVEVFDIDDFGASLASARSAGHLDPVGQRVLASIVAADLLVVGSPTYKGSYTGLFKHVFDLIDPVQLRGKPVLIAATGGGERHSLVVEHHFRPLFGFFEALTLPTALYAVDRDLADGVPVPDALRSRVAQAVSEASRMLGASHAPATHRVAIAPAGAVPVVLRSLG